jgi:hypothetical protein
MREKLSWKNEMKHHPSNVHVFFLESDPSRSEGDVRVQGSTVYVGGKDSFKPGILKKTVAAISSLPSHDYYLRTTLGTVVDPRSLTSFCKSKGRAYAGGPGVGKNRRNDTDHAWTPGWGILMGHERAMRLLGHMELHQDLLDSDSVADDVAIGEAIAPEDAGPSYSTAWDPKQTTQGNIERMTAQRPAIYRARDADPQDREALAAAVLG